MTAPAYLAVLAERTRQDVKWGTLNHDPFVYLAILMEEAGETAQAALQARFEGGGALARQRLRAEAVQTAAVALGLVECLDRDQWAWGNHAVPPEVPGCDTCRFRDDEPKVFRWVDTVMTGPFCGKAGRTTRDDTPNDDDGNPIVVRCETLGNRCGAWEGTDG